MTSYDGKCGRYLQAGAILDFMTFEQRQTTTENSWPRAKTAKELKAKIV